MGKTGHHVPSLTSLSTLGRPLWRLLSPPFPCPLPSGGLPLMPGRWRLDIFSCASVQGGGRAARRRPAIPPDLLFPTAAPTAPLTAPTDAALARPPPAAAAAGGEG